jgi:hypothetical protein
MCIVLALFIAPFTSLRMGQGMFPAKIYVGQIAVVFGIVVTSTWGATQWAAHALGYQDGLGSPLGVPKTSSGCDAALESPKLAG